MPTRKRRLWLPMSREPVCRLYALWRRERDVAQFHVTERTGSKDSATRVFAPPGGSSHEERVEPEGRVSR